MMEGFLNEFKSIYLDNEAYVWINGLENEWFKIDCRVKQWCLFFHGYLMFMDGVIEELILRMIEEGVRVMKIGRSGGCPVHYMLLIWFCGEFKESLRLLVEGFDSV